MIITSFLQDGQLVRNYSNINRKIRQVETGILYNDAIDIVPCRYTYEETDVPIPDEDVPEEE